MNNITLEQIKVIFSLYKLGVPKNLEYMKSGYVNDSYKVETTEGIYLLRFYKSLSVKEIEYESNLISDLFAFGVPVAKTITNNNNVPATKTPYGNATVFEFIKGAMPNINEKTVAQIAKAVAKMNSFPDWRKYERINPRLNKDYFLNIAKNAEGNKSIEELVSYFIKQNKRLLNYLDETLPSGLIHADVFPDNTIFEGDNLKAILDFSEVSTGPLLMDVAVTIGAFCFVKNKFSKELQNTFLKGYQDIRPLVDKEHNLLPTYIRLGMHIYIAWHIDNYSKNDSAVSLSRARQLMDRSEDYVTSAAN